MGRVASGFAQRAETTARQERETGLRIDLDVPYRLSEDAKAKRVKRLAPKPRRPFPAPWSRRSSARWAKPEATLPKGEAKPRATLFS